MEDFYTAGIVLVHKNIPFPELFQDYTEQWNEQNLSLSLFPSEAPLYNEFVGYVTDCFLLRMHKRISCIRRIWISRAHIQIRFHLSQVCQTHEILCHTFLCI